MTSARHLRANQTPRNVTTRHVRHISCRVTKLNQKYSSHAPNLLNVKKFNPIFIIALKAGISSSVHTIILRKQTQTKHPIGLILFYV